MTQDEDNAMQNLQNMTNKISINGNGLGRYCILKGSCHSMLRTCPVKFKTERVGLKFVDPEISIYLGLG